MGRKNTALVIFPFSFILRFPFSTPYFIFCFRFFSILTASFRLFLKVYSVYLCRQLLFFFFFLLCLSVSLTLRLSDLLFWRQIFAKDCP